MPESQLEQDAMNGCKGACPFSQIPMEAWKQLFKQPFRKRHPLIFWLGAMIVLSLAIFGAIQLFDEEEEKPAQDSIALIRIQGIIANVEPVLGWIRTLEKTPYIKGALVRVDSPGGGAAASQEIYAALERLGKKMPIVVSMGATAASGGLMVSMAGQRIFANPSTVTGSIGVRMDIPQLQGLMDKIGVGQETLVTAPYKDAASYLHPLTPQDRAYLMSVIENMHSQFVEIIAKGRKMDISKVRELASGKIFTGQEAQKLGLVDELGGQDAALEWICQQTQVPFDRKLFTRPRSKSPFMERLLSASSQIFEHIIELKENFKQPAFLYQ